MSRGDKLGQKSGTFCVIAKSHQDSASRWHWVMQCSCGALKVVAGNQIPFRGHCSKCQPSPNRKHGARYTAEWGVWQGMRRRCQDVKCKDYPRYGGAGITVDPAWNDFATFLNDMGKRPTPEHQIDRINTKGPYAKHNCRWATRSLNQSNKIESSWWFIRGRKFSNCMEASKFFKVTTTTVCRWVRGAFDKRRNASVPKRNDCYLLPKYENSQRIPTA